MVRNVGIRNYGSRGLFANDRFGSLNNHEYKIYVHRRDYEMASVLLRAGKI